MPRQEAGRLSAKELVLSRANKSVRLFDAVVDALAAGRQPDIRDILNVGYLMRTTAVYGNGKFGLGDFPLVKRHPELDGPYRAEMLCVYMIRHFQCELAEHVARARTGSKAAKLDPTIRRAFGIGNATGTRHGAVPNPPSDPHPSLDRREGDRSGIRTGGRHGKHRG